MPGADLRAVFLGGALSLAAALPAPAQAPGGAPQRQEEAMAIHVLVAGRTLRATLDDTAVARDFAAMLPLELALSDYHGIEKVADLPRRLDTDGAPESYEPRAGDITVYAPWGNLAIFYKPFSRSRGLVRLGEFEDDLAPLLRGGEVPVRIEAAD